MTRCISLNFFVNVDSAGDVAAINELSIIKRILIASSDIICDNLDPKLVLRTMKIKGALTPYDVELIESMPVKSDQAEVMLNILMKKPASAYEIFMETLLAKGRKDLYDPIKDIEVACRAGRLIRVRAVFHKSVRVCNTFTATLKLVSRVRLPYFLEH